ncbi:hypothetical protein CRE_28670 [Caenorhabditis remanei]|uniref:K Homology domain-containing protein n=1 Tax=Caenorhabditis remanei TaxID=31234 RepID=E3MJY0_CAERE|nr:hypothetical protein CRE_28670 [Caenorhabditis remanei]
MSKSHQKKSTDDSANKTAHNGREEEGGDHLSIKILIPSSAVCDIIGRSGETMRNLRKKNSCQIQISKDGDTYPGTTERICFVKGRLNHIVAVIESIQEKIRKKCPNQTGNDAFDLENTLRGDEIKIVMPNTSAGMVIGKSSNNLKLIKKRFGSKVEIYPKVGSVEAKTALERVVTVAHEESAALLKSIRRILKHVALDPHHSSQINKEDFKKAAKGIEKEKEKEKEEEKEKEKEQEKEKEKEKEQEEEEKRDSPIQCMVTGKTCFRDLQKHYQLTKKVVGCPASEPGHPTAAHVRRWIDMGEWQ